jgi:histidinol phosphatase-like PHP family hydrolase
MNCRKPWTNFHCHTSLFDDTVEKELTHQYYSIILGEKVRRVLIADHGFMQYFHNVVPSEVIWQGWFMEDPSWFDKAREVGDRRLRESMQAVRGLNNRDIFFGIETDMMRDGRLTHDPAMTDEFDVILCGPHFMPWIEKLESVPEKESAWLDYMEMLLSKSEVDVLAHPFRRLAVMTNGVISDDTVLRLLRWVEECGVSLELNSNANTPPAAETRMLRFAADHGIPIVVGTDAHKCAQTVVFDLAEQRLRQAGLTPDDLNLQEVEAYLARKGNRHTAASRSRARLSPGTAPLERQNKGDHS